LYYIYVTLISGISCFKCVRYDSPCIYLFIYLFIVLFLQGVDDDDSASVTTVSVLSCIHYIKQYSPLDCLSVCIHLFVIFVTHTQTGPPFCIVVVIFCCFLSVYLTKSNCNVHNQTTR